LGRNDKENKKQTVSANLKNMGSGLVKGTEMVLKAIKIIPVY
jgi:hypothetical protein